MILISHRGNINGENKLRENHPEYIDEAIYAGYDVEIDIWILNDKIFLGHDEPLYEINLDWLEDRKTKIWLHCKNIDSLLFFKTNLYEFNYFWHETDTITLTSYNHIWAYPGKQPIKNSISVLPELHDDNTSLCIGICSDVIEKYNKKI